MNPSDDDLGNAIPLPPESSEPADSKRAPILRDDVVWENVDGLLVEEDADISLVPLDPQVEINRRAIREHLLPVDRVWDEDEEAPDQYQFSIRDMLILNSVLAVVLALMRAFAPSAVAGVLGIATLLAAAVLAVCQAESRRVEMAWWCMLATYVATCAFAIFR